MEVIVKREIVWILYMAITVPNLQIIKEEVKSTVLIIQVIFYILMINLDMQQVPNIAEKKIIQTVFKMKQNCRQVYCNF